MKTLVASILLIVNTLWGIAQITLENTYAYSTSVSEVNSEEYYYFLMDVPLQQCRIYTDSHTLYKTINLSIPEGYYLSDIKFVTSNLFNTDNLIELLYIYEKYITTETDYYFQYGLAVVNEEGSQLLTLPNGGWAEIKQVNSENKLFAYSYMYNPLGYYDITTNIYMLGGTSNYISYSSYDTELVFPNPAKDQIVINTSILPEFTDGEFNMFSISGQKVLSSPLSTGQRITLPISQLSSGTYLYSIKDKSNLILSNKIIIR